MSPPAKINKFVDDIHNKRKDFSVTKKQIWTIFRSELSISPIPPPLVSPTEQKYHFFKDKFHNVAISIYIKALMVEESFIRKIPASLLCFPGVDRVRGLLRSVIKL